MNYINEQKNQNKNPKSKTSCPTMYKYLRQHFNPKLLPRLLLHLLSNHYAQKISCTQSGDIKVISTIINIPSVSIMFSNMKLYDNQRIAKENRVIDAMLKIREKWSQMWDNREGNKVGDRYSNQRQTACTFQRDTVESFQGRNRNKMELNLLQILELSYRSFDILDYRLKDLVSFLEVISHISMERQFVSMTQKQLKNTIYQLYNICDVVLSKIERLKLYIQRCTGIFMDYGQKIMVQGNKIILILRNTEQCSKHQKNNLFLNRNHALYYKQKLKQINEKYTFISRQIFAKQAEERKKRKYRNRNRNRNKNKNKYRQNNIHTQQAQYQCENDLQLQSGQFCDGQNYSMGTFKGNFCSFGKNCNQQEFGRKKFGFKKEKRISIQVMASLLEQQFKSRRKIVNGLNSKFQQRPAISIGTKRTIQKKAMDLQKTNKQLKKQVKIDNLQLQLQLKKENKKQKKGIISKSNSPLASPKGKKQLKSAKKTKLQIFQQLCERADKEDEENQKSICSILGKKVHSWNQRNGSSCESDSPIVSRSVISKCRTQMYPSLSRKVIFKTGKYLPRRSFLSCKELKYYKQSKKAKQKNQMSESFKQLINIALDRKGNKKKHLNIQRSGRIIPLDSQDYFQITERFDISKKRNQQLKSKGNKDRFKLGKSKYNQILEEGTNKENEQTFDEAYDKNSLHAEPKVVRRVGITVSSDVEEIKPTQQKQPQKLKKSIRRTFGSNYSRKQQAISNKRLHNEDMSSTANKFYYPITTEQPFCIPNQYKVKPQQKQNLSKRVVRIHTQIECSLYKITRQHEKLDLQQIEQQNSHRNRILELGKISDEEIKKLFKYKYKCKFNDGGNQMGIEDDSQIRKFHEENVQFGLSRVMLGEANRLHQKDMAWLGK